MVFVPGTSTTSSSTTASTCTCTSYDMVDNENAVLDDNGDHLRSTASPTICSLTEYKVVITDEVHLFLSGLYEHQVVENKTTSDIDDHKGQSIEHFNQVLDAMKSAPETTICRINSIGKDSNNKCINTVNHAKQELHLYLKEWLSSRSELNSFRITIDDHPLFQDVIRINVTVEGDDYVSVYSQRVPQVLNNNKSATKCEQPHPRLFENWPSRGEQGWPMTHRAILCDRFCGEAVLRGSDIFVCGIIAADTGIQVNEIVAVYADCTNYNTITTTRNNLEAREAPQSSKTTLPSRGMILTQFSGQCVYLGLGKSVCKRSNYFSKRNGLGIEMLPQCRSLRNNNNVLPPLSGALPNTVFLQNEPSILVGTLLYPFDDNQRILDMCSAPGGKALHVANLTRNLSNVVIVSCDVSRKKMVAAKLLFNRYGATNIIPIALDSTRCCRHLEENEASEGYMSLNEVLSSATKSDDGLLQIASFPPESFDRILLDPPCSALGLRPKLQIPQTSIHELLSFVHYQQLLVREAVALLKPGGLMTYSTCTIHVNENEGMVKHILDEYCTQMELVPIDILCGLPGLSGFGLTDEQCQFVRRFDPSNTSSDTIGFFVAKFRKI